MIKRIIKVILFLPVLLICLPYAAIKWVIYGDEIEDGDLLIDKLIEW